MTAALRPGSMLDASSVAKDETTMAEGVSGALVAIFGTESPSSGCHCEHHPVCGRCLELDYVVRFKKTIIWDEGKFFGTQKFDFLLSPFHSVPQKKMTTGLLLLPFG